MPRKFYTDKERFVIVSRVTLARKEGRMKPRLKWQSRYKMISELPDQSTVMLNGKPYAKLMSGTAICLKPRSGKIVYLRESDDLSAVSW